MLDYPIVAVPIVQRTISTLPTCFFYHQNLKQFGIGIVHFLRACQSHTLTIYCQTWNETQPTAPESTTIANIYTTTSKSVTIFVSYLKVTLTQTFSLKDVQCNDSCDGSLHDSTMDPRYITGHPSIQKKKYSKSIHYQATYCKLSKNVAHIGIH